MEPTEYEYTRQYESLPSTMRGVIDRVSYDADLGNKSRVAFKKLLSTLRSALRGLEPDAPFLCAVGATLGPASFELVRSVRADDLIDGATAEAGLVAMHRLGVLATAALAAVDASSAAAFEIVSAHSGPLDADARSTLKTKLTTLAKNVAFQLCACNPELLENPDELTDVVARDLRRPQTVMSLLQRKKITAAKKATLHVDHPIDREHWAHLLPVLTATAKRARTVDVSDLVDVITNDLTLRRRLGPVDPNSAAPSYSSVARLALQKAWEARRKLDQSEEPQSPQLPDSESERASALSTYSSTMTSDGRVEELEAVRAILRDAGMRAIAAANLPRTGSTEIADGIALAAVGRALTDRRALAALSTVAVEAPSQDISATLKEFITTTVRGNGVSASQVARTVRMALTVIGTR